MQAGGVRHADTWHRLRSSVEQLTATPINPPGVFYSAQCGAITTT